MSFQCALLSLPLGKNCTAKEAQVSSQSKASEVLRKVYNNMKSYNHLFEQFISHDNLYQAILNAAKRKKKRFDVQKVLANPEPYIRKLQKMLGDKTYVIQPHKAIQIYDGSSHKERLIIQPRFVFEQIIQHALIQVLQPIFMRGMYQFSCGSIPDRGAHYGKRYVEKFINNNDPAEIKYVLKMDIHHYYQSVDIELIRSKFRKLIHDQDLLYVIDLILDSNIAEWEGEHINMGLPIGYYTSQWFANWFLQDFDHLVKEQLGAKCYIRYVDDIVIFARNKKKLHQDFLKIREYMSSINLEIKDNWQIFRFEYISKDRRIGRPLDFMGFKFYRDRTTLRKSIMARIVKKSRRLANRDRLTWFDASQVLSYLGWLNHTDTHNLYYNHIRPNVNIGVCRNILSRRQKLINKENEYGTNLQNSGELEQAS